jgi:hypothetical protein
MADGLPRRVSGKIDWRLPQLPIGRRFADKGHYCLETEKSIGG